MRKEQNIMLVLLTAICFLLPVTAFAYPNEQTGFDGLEWGTDIATVRSQMTLVDDVVDSGSGDKLYTSSMSGNVLGQAELLYIRYMFHNDKLCGVKIMPKDNSWPALRNILFDVYGRADEEDQTSLRWNGDKTNIAFYSNDSYRGNALYLKKKVVTIDMGTVTSKSSDGKIIYPKEIENCEPCKRLWMANNQKS